MTKTVHQTHESLLHGTDELLLEGEAFIGGRKGELTHGQMLKYQQNLRDGLFTPLPRSFPKDTVTWRKSEHYAPALPPNVSEQVAELEQRKEVTAPSSGELSVGLEKVASSVSSSLDEMGKTLVWITSLPSKFSRYFLDLDNKEKDPEIEHTAVAVLLPFQAQEEAKAAIDDRYMNKSFELVLLQVLKQRVSNLMEEFLKGIEKALHLDHHMKWVKYTQKEIRDTVESQQTWGQWGSMVGMFVGTLGPKLVISQSFTDPLRRLGMSFVPDFGDPITKGDWMKMAQNAGQMLPNMFQTQSQVYQALGQGVQLGGQARMDRAMKRADAASNQYGEVKQNKNKDFDLTKSILEHLNMANKIFQ
ncbi:MAG: hypothetical protein JSR80_07615 [Verrucomicrobia bacterium]|nr:hypothetical protein [Verrucomicrobiota bacterium]